MKTIAAILFGFALSSAQTLPSVPSTPAAPTQKPAAKTTPPAPQTKKPASSAKPAATSGGNQAPAQSIPAGAKLVEPNLYRYTDSNGKTWNYRQTPFGISKWEEPSSSNKQGSEAPAASAPAAAAPAKNEPVAVTDLGDSYRFQKKTPFGQSTWVRKKSDLSGEEKAYVEQQPAAASNNPGANSPGANSPALAAKPAGNQ